VTLFTSYQQRVNVLLNNITFLPFLAFPQKRDVAVNTEGLHHRSACDDDYCVYTRWTRNV